jgi:hypothetical protein
MREWHIKVPYRDMDDSLIDVASYCRHLDGPHDEAAVTRQIVLDERVRGLKTAAGMAAFVESLTSAQRRELIDEARAELGLPSTAEVEASEPATRAMGLANSFPILDSDLPPHLHGHGLGEVLS